MNETKSEAKVQTWLRQIENGNIDSAYAACIYYITMNPGATIFEMRENLQITHQTLTSALSNLMDKGAIKYQGQKRQGRNMDIYSQFVYVSSDVERAKLRAQREHDKFLSWLKQAEKYADRVEVVLKSAE